MASRGACGGKRGRCTGNTVTATDTHTVRHRLPPSERCYTEINVTLLCCLCLLACTSPSCTPSGCCCSYVLVRYLRWQRALPSTAHKSCAINRTLDVLSDPAEAASLSLSLSYPHSLTASLSLPSHALPCLSLPLFT